MPRGSERVNVSAVTLALRRLRTRQLVLEQAARDPVELSSASLRIYHCEREDYAITARRVRLVAYRRATEEGQQRPVELPRPGEHWQMSRPEQ
jgi:hypothetical protein